MGRAFICARALPPNPLRVLTWASATQERTLEHTCRPALPGLQPQPPTIRGEDQISYLNRAALRIQAGPLHKQRHSVHGQSERLSLLSVQPDGTRLESRRSMPAPPAAPPSGDEQRRPAARIPALQRLPADRHTCRNVEATRQVGRGAATAGVDDLAPVGPVAVGIGEGAHGRRVGHVQPTPLLSFEGAAPAEEADGEADGLLMNPVLGRKVDTGRDLLASRPLALLDAAHKGIGNTAM